MIVKICGITSARDARIVAAAGGDAVGFVFAPSRRRIAPEDAKAIDRSATANCRRVGVFVDATVEQVHAAADTADLDIVQLHGDESPADCRRLSDLGLHVWKRLDVRGDDTPAGLAARGLDYRVDALLIDPGRGDGRTFRWSLAKAVEGTVIVAGGLTPDNVADAIHAARPEGVDVSGGVERSPGIKDESKIRAFVERARAAG